MIVGEQFVCPRSTYCIARANRKNLIPSGRPRYRNLVVGKNKYGFDNPIIDYPRFEKYWNINSNYNGSYCDDVGVRPGRYYNDFDEAVFDAVKLADKTRWRFWVYRMDGKIYGVANRNGFRVGEV